MYCEFRKTTLGWEQMKRTYESPLRAEQADRTREKLVLAGIDIVADAGSEELTIRRVAARAQVSVPTAYRHFPDPDKLLDAMAVWVNERLVGAGIPEDADDFASWVQHVYRAFEANDRLVRAQLNSPAGRALRAKHHKGRWLKIRETMERSFPTLTPVTRHRLTALVQLLANINAWISLHDNWGLSGADAGNISSWAVEVLFAEVRRHPNALDFGANEPTSSRSKAGLRRGPG
jgi:AcrR family transcriptional regulator